MTNTAAHAIDFSRKPSGAEPTPFHAYYFTADITPELPWTPVTVWGWDTALPSGNVYGVVDFEGLEAHASLEELRLPLGLVCPECGERALERAPRELGGSGRFSHWDGTTMCPVVGASGYEPAQAVSY